LSDSSLREHPHLLQRGHALTPQVLHDHVRSVPP